MTDVVVSDAGDELLPLIFLVFLLVLIISLCP